MKLSQLTDEDLWLAIAEVGEAMSGLAKLQRVLRPSAGLFDESNIGSQLLDRLETMRKLRSCFDDYFAELKRRHPSDGSAARSED